MAYTAFIKFSTITGESKDGAPGESIQLDSWSWGVASNGSFRSGGGAGRPSYQDFAFTANVGTHSPGLFLAAAQSRDLGNAVVTILNDGAAVLIIRFTEVFVASYKIDESGKIGIGLADAAVTLNIAEPSSTDLAKPVESVALTFRTAELQAGGSSSFTSVP
jgi:type VI protein secretion system component Hcp